MYKREKLRYERVWFAQILKGICGWICTPDFWYLETFFSSLSPSLQISPSLLPTGWNAWKELRIHICQISLSTRYLKFRRIKQSTLCLEFFFQLVHRNSQEWWIVELRLVPHPWNDRWIWRYFCFSGEKQATTRFLDGAYHCWNLYVVLKWEPDGKVRQEAWSSRRKWIMKWDLEGFDA